MTTDIKELVQTARNHSLAVANGMLNHQAAVTLSRAADALGAINDTLEMVVAERDRMLDAASDRIMAIAAERDRLKAALVRLGTHINISAGERLLIVQEALGGDV